MTAGGTGTFDWHFQASLDEPLVLELAGLDFVRGKVDQLLGSSPGPPQSADHDDVGLGEVKQRDDQPTAAHTRFDRNDRSHPHLTAITSNIKLSAWASSAAPGRSASW